MATKKEWEWQQHSLKKIYFPTG